MTLRRSDSCYLVIVGKIEVRLKAAFGPLPEVAGPILRRSGRHNVDTPTSIVNMPVLAFHHTASLAGKVVIITLRRSADNNFAAEQD